MSRRSERWHRNKIAFDSIIGDPFSKPEPIEGRYAALKSRSSVIVVNNEPQSSPSPVNQARPSVTDFLIDVDAAIQDGMSTMHETAFRIFLDTYITEDESAVRFNQKERSKVEQLIGNILVERKIYPASRYFTAIRK